MLNLSHWDCTFLVASDLYSLLRSSLAEDKIFKVLLASMHCSSISETAKLHP